MNSISSPVEYILDTSTLTDIDAFDLEAAEITLVLTGLVYERPTKLTKHK